MESKRDTPSSSTPYLAGDRGGKFRKPPARKPPRTPYDRPPANQQSTELHDGGWLSKLVTPARRLIAGSATKILPSLFSKSISSVADFSPSNTDEFDHDDQDIEATPNAGDDSKRILRLGVPSSTGEAGPSNTVDRLKDNSENTNLQQDNSRNLCDDSELAKIEYLVKGKRFSRDEIDRLTEILNSRVVDVPDAERENKTLSVIPQEPAKGDLDHENSISSIRGKQYNMERAILETPRPHFQSNMQDEVVASPIDIARAYMGSRTSEIGLGSYNMKSKDERDQQEIDVFAAKPFIPTPSPKSSACWPGAMVQDQRGYLTPQTQRVKYGLHSFPRTPYSRTIYLRTKPKLTQLQADSRSPNISSTPFQQSRTPNYGQVMSRSDAMDGVYGSVGPIRRMRNKFATEAPSRGSSFLYSGQKAPSQPEKSSSSSGFLPVSGKNLEAGGTSGTSDYHSVGHIEQATKGVVVSTAPSNQTVRKILEQLDKHKPTPKEKAAELKLATEWKRSPLDNNVLPKESTSLGALAGFDLHKKGDLSERKFSVERTVERGNYKGRPHETDATNAMTKTSSTETNNGCIVDDAGAGTSLGFKNTHNSQIKNTDEKAILGSNNIKEIDSSHAWSFDNRSNGQDLSRKRSSQPTLKPISFKRPDPQQVVSSDNGRGFTFPFAAPAGLASEPPTPSIMPSFPASGTVPQQKDVPANIPTYSFGTKKSSSRIVFSFPSTSSASVDVDPSDLKFNFGSEKKNRVSFGSVGKDAICY